MAEQTQTSAAPAATKLRRGIATARGTQRLKFTHELAKSNGLFIGHLEKVETSMITIGESTTGMPSFNGMEIPRLRLTFATNEPEENKRHYVTMSFTAVESTVDTIPGGKSEWQVSRLFDYMKHLLNVYYLKGRELNEQEVEALSLTFEDFDENGVFVPVAVEQVIAAYTTLFENFVALMEKGKNDMPVYLDKDGKFIPIWIKLVRHIKNKKGWVAVANGDLAFPTFVGEGVIEIWKQNTPASIRLDVIRECITPKEETKEAKAPTIPGIATPGIPAGGVAIDPMMGSMAGLSAEAGTDMPF